MYSLWHGLYALTVVPWSTHPSILRVTVKWVSAFGLSNTNKWRWWMWIIVAYRRTHKQSWLAWFEGWRHLGLSPHSLNELSQWLCHDDSTINIVVGISISTSIIRPHCSTTYIDATYCYTPSSVSVFLSSVTLVSPAKNGCTDRDAVWVEDSDGPKEPCIRWGPRSPMGRVNIGERGAHCKI